jgi:hypothetical protein
MSHHPTNTKSDLWHELSQQQDQIHYLHQQNFGNYVEVIGILVVLVWIANFLDFRFCDLLYEFVDTPVLRLVTPMWIYPLHVFIWMKEGDAFFCFLYKPPER